MLIGDLLSDPADIAAMIDSISQRGARGHLIMIADPVEETFPFAGHVEFVDVDLPARLRVGDAEAFRADYVRRLAAHRDDGREAARARGWTLMLHRTDRPASEALLALRMQLEAGSPNARGAGDLMFGIPLAFTAPLALAALAGLPLLYYLLRVTPPRPRQVPFPPLRLILDLIPASRTPRRTPLWLLILRLAIAACIILAMAGPVLHPPAPGAGAGPLLVVLDDGWPAAPSFARRIEAAAARIEAAGRRSRPIAVIATSDGPREIAPTDAAKALDRLRAVNPVPYAPDRRAALEAISRFVSAHPQSSIVWIADGVEAGHARDFAGGPRRHERQCRDRRRGRAGAGAGRAAKPCGRPRSARAASGDSAGPEQGEVRALDLKGLAIGSAPFDFAGKAETKAKFDLPVELRNRDHAPRDRERAFGAARFRFSTSAGGGAASASSAAKRPTSRSRCWRRTTI